MNIEYIPLSEGVEKIIDYRGKTPKKLGSDWVDKGIRTISAKNVHNGELDNIESIRCVSEDIYEKWMKDKIQRNDIFIASEGASMGESLIWESDEQIVLGQRLFAVRANTEVFNPFYLAMYMRTQEYRKELENHCTGTSVMGLSQPNLLKTKIRYIPIERQNFIGEMYQNICNKIAVNNGINRNLAEQLRIIFEDMFITNADSKWPKKKLCDFLDLERGLSYKGKFLAVDEGVPMLNLGNILPNSVFRPEKLKFYTGEFKPRHVVKPGDIIVANTDLTQAREVLGSAIRVPDLGYEAVICSHHISIVKNSKISNNFILGLLNMPSYRTRVAGYATGTTVLALPNDTILNCEFQCPIDDLLIKYDEIAELIYGKMEEIRRENDNLDLIRDSLLPKLMSGELDVSELEI